jgi:hypothetical protein
VAQDPKRQRHAWHGPGREGPLVPTGCHLWALRRNGARPRPPALTGAWVITKVGAIFPTAFRPGRRSSRLAPQATLATTRIPSTTLTFWPPRRRLLQRRRLRPSSSTKTSWRSSCLSSSFPVTRTRSRCSRASCAESYLRNRSASPSRTSTSSHSKRGIGPGQVIRQILD